MSFQSNLPAFLFYNQLRILNTFQWMVKGECSVEVGPHLSFYHTFLFNYAKWDKNGTWENKENSAIFRHSIQFFFSKQDLW